MKTRPYTGKNKLKSFIAMAASYDFAQHADRQAETMQLISDIKILFCE